MISQRRSFCDLAKPPSSLGDYSVNPKKLPNGLRGLGEKLNAIGLQFGLWFEPESVSPDSDLYRKHPDWALHDSLGREDLLGRHQLLLDLTKPDVRDYIVESVGKVLDSAPISYVKWDMNRHSCALGAKQHEFVLGLYDVLRRIFEPRPEILLESCSSGGNRFDCGMLYFSPQIRPPASVRMYLQVRTHRRCAQRRFPRAETSVCSDAWAMNWI